MLRQKHHKQIATYWERLKFSPIYETHLKPGITLQELGNTAKAMSDNEAAEQVQEARTRLLQFIPAQPNPAA